MWDKIKSSGFLNAKKRPLVSHENICVFYGSPPIYNYQKTFHHKRKISKRKSHLQTPVYGKMKTNYEYDSTERYPRSIQSFSTDTQNSSLHPTQKPVALCEYLIKTYTNRGDIVLDNCAGSGTTGIACINSGRNYIMIEKEKKYFDIIQDRIANHKLKGIQNNLLDE